jgi:S1-C subfamily serine protease
MPPIDFTREATRQLHRALVDVYYTDDSMVALLEHIGIHKADILRKSTPRDTWQAELGDLDNRMKVDALLDAVLVDPKAAKIYPTVRAFREGSLARAVTEPAFSPNRPVEDEVKLLEKIMGAKSTLLDICFLQAGLEAATAVAKLEVMFPRGRGLGTGFLIARDRLLTNHHVLFDRGAKTSDVSVIFDYEVTLNGTTRAPVFAEADLDSILGEEDGDWATFRLKTPVEGRAPLRLATEASPAGAWVAVIQHPRGLPKKIALHHNVVTFADGDVVQYLADTEGGSSGSPVFDERWQVVALHQAGGDLPLPGTKATVFRNQGIPIAKVVARLAALGITVG